MKEREDFLAEDVRIVCKCKAFEGQIEDSGIRLLYFLQVGRTHNTLILPNSIPMKTNAQTPFMAPPIPRLFLSLPSIHVLSNTLNKSF